MGSPTIAGSPPASPIIAPAAAADDDDNNDIDDAVPSSVPQTLWALTVPVLVTHASAPDHPPLVTAVPRFSYLALLLPRLAAFFGRPCSSFHHEDVLLRNLAVGLLADLYLPPLPWRLVVNDGPSWDIADTFLNCVKEADYARNGNAHQIMKMSKQNTTALWNAVQDNDYAAFARIHALLLRTPAPIRHVPIRLYVPLSASPASPTPAAAASSSFRVLQALVPVLAPSSRPQPNHLGAALRQLAPSLFPSSRDPVLAAVLLHGAHVPFAAPLVDLMREATYPDGWLSLIVVLL